MATELEGLEGVLKRLESIAEIETWEKGLQKAVLLVEREAVKKAPKGELQQYTSSRVNGLTGEVFNPLFYAPYVEYGTGLFATGKGGGRKEVPWVYVEGSTHSSNKKTVYASEADAKRAVAMLRAEGLDAHMTYGQHPQPFLRPALDENRDEVLRILRGELKNND